MSEPERYPRRAAKARANRRRILEAAIGAFAEHGYAATTIAAVADAADVAEQTVYAVFGNKRALLEEALDVAISGDDEPVPVNDRPWMRPVWEATDAASTLRAYAAAVCLIHSRAARLFEALDVAASAEPALVDLAAQTRGRRRLGAGGVLAAAAQRPGGHPGLASDESVDVLWSLIGHQLFLLLTRDCGWDEHRYRTWLGGAMVALLASG